MNFDDSGDADSSSPMQTFVTSRIAVLLLEWWVQIAMVVLRSRTEGPGKVPKAISLDGRLSLCLRLDRFSVFFGPATGGSGHPAF